MAATQDDDEFGMFLAYNAPAWLEVLRTCHQPFNYPHWLHLCTIVGYSPSLKKHFLRWCATGVDPTAERTAKKVCGPTKELHQLDHCFRQYLRHRPIADDGRVRCLVMEHPFHWCGFILPITRTNTCVTTWHDATSCCTHTTTYWGRRCWLIFYHASSSPRCPETRKKKKKKNNNNNNTGFTTISACSRVVRICHTPTTRRRIQPLPRSADNGIRGRNPNGDQHIQGQQPTSQSHLRVHASNVTEGKKPVTHPCHDHLMERCRRVWIETSIFCVY